MPSHPPVWNPCETYLAVRGAPKDMATIAYANRDGDGDLLNATMVIGPDEDGRPDLSTFVVENGRRRLVPADLDMMTGFGRMFRRVMVRRRVVVVSTSTV